MLWKILHYAVMPLLHLDERNIFTKFFSGMLLYDFLTLPILPIIKINLVWNTLESNKENKPIKPQRPRASSTTELSRSRASSTRQVTQFASSATGIIILWTEALHTESAVEHKAWRARFAMEWTSAVAFSAVVVAVATPSDALVKTWKKDCDDVAVSLYVD